MLLKLVADDGHLIGAINWFAVHGTSMNNTNTFISGDNKGASFIQAAEICYSDVGYASYLLERDINKGAEPGKGPFVAAFGSTNLGDVSPNTQGAKVTLICQINFFNVSVH